MITKLKNPKTDSYQNVKNYILSKRFPWYRASNIVSNTDEPIIVENGISYHNIPYELFSLDSGDYKETFGLDKALDREVDPTPCQYAGLKWNKCVPDFFGDGRADLTEFDDEEVDEWIEEYLAQYP